MRGGRCASRIGRAFPLRVPAFDAAGCSLLFFCLLLFAGQEGRRASHVRGSPARAGGCPRQGAFQSCIWMGLPVSKGRPFLPSSGPRVSRPLSESPLSIRLPAQAITEDILLRHSVYGDVYAPSSCALCKSERRPDPRQGAKLLPCGRGDCRFLYCCEDHRKEHWLDHQWACTGAESLPLPPAAGEEDSFATSGGGGGGGTGPGAGGYGGPSASSSAWPT